MVALKGEWVKLPEGLEGLIMKLAGCGELPTDAEAGIVFFGEHTQHGHCVACAACAGDPDCCAEGR